MKYIYIFTEWEEGGENEEIAKVFSCQELAIQYMVDTGMGHEDWGRTEYISHLNRWYRYEVSK